MLPPQPLIDDPAFHPVTRAWLVRDLQALGIRVGGVLMVHLRLSALRFVVGGVDAVLVALREVVGPDGTLVAFTGWEGSPFHAPLLPDPWRTAYQTDTPPFDPAYSAARRDFGCFPERLRTWPGAMRSTHPEVSFAAVGPAATGLISGADEHADPWGPDGVLGRLVRADGQVLLLGAPLKTLTLCHHAEALADVPGKRFHTYAMPVKVDGEVHWRTYRTLDTFYGALPYWDHPQLQIDSAVSALAEQAVAAGAGQPGTVAYAPSWLFQARPAVAAVRTWLERTFGDPPAADATPAGSDTSADHG
jgi:aminoglycoside 3-N-acetyltransferase